MATEKVVAVKAERETTEPHPQSDCASLLILSLKESLSLFFAFLFSSFQSQECFSKLFPPPTLAFFPSISLSLIHANIHTPSPGPQHLGPPSFILSVVSSISKSNLLLIKFPHLSYGTCRSRRYYERLLAIKAIPGKQVQLSKVEIRQLCLVSKDIFLDWMQALSLASIPQSDSGKLVV